MDFVSPKNIASPMTGAVVKPRIMKFERNDKVYEEAHWYCPDTGQFIMKGVVSITEKTIPKDTPNKVDPS